MYIRFKVTLFQACIYVPYKRDFFFSLAGLDLATHNSTDGDGTTRPRRQDNTHFINYREFRDKLHHHQGDQMGL
jgi:hypothetical protein